MAFDQDWVPKTRLGKLVFEGQVTSMEEAIKSGLPIREPRIIDMLLPDLEDEVLDINMVQRMTDSGRRVKFRATVIVGDRNGYVGLGQAKDVQVGPAIRKAIDAAKLAITYIRRGCGSWECACGLPHTVPYEVKGKAGSVSVILIPAPRGLGIAAGNTATKVLEKAGIKDVWTNTFGTTRSTLNFAKATFDALNHVNVMRLPIYRRKEEA
jgi:small subunit ribosomal protein S5